jgi:hypothetical protein
MTVFSATLPSSEDYGAPAMAALLKYSAEIFLLRSFIL